MASRLHTPNPRALDDILHSDTWDALIQHLHLSEREAEIVECILRHADDEPSIAARMNISSHTVHTHLERLYRKLEVSSRSQLVTTIFITYTTLNQSETRLMSP